MTHKPLHSLGVFSTTIFHRPGGTTPHYPGSAGTIYLLKAFGLAVDPVCQIRVVRRDHHGDINTSSHQKQTNVVLSQGGRHVQPKSRVVSHSFTEKKPLSVANDRHSASGSSRHK